MKPHKVRATCTRNTQPMFPTKEKSHFFTSTNFRHHFFRLYFLGLGRAQPETRKARKPAVFGPARWPVSPRAGTILGPTRTLFFSGHEPTNFGKKHTFFEKYGLLTCFSDGLGTRNTQPMSPPKEKSHFLLAKILATIFSGYIF